MISQDILTASSPKEMLEHRIALQQKQITDALAPYDPRSATLAWFDTLRAIEEFINLMTVDWDDDNFESSLISLPVIGFNHNRARFLAIRQRLVTKFGRNFGIRFTNLLLQGALIGEAFVAHGIIDVAEGFHTVGTMMGFLQSRRRHFVGMLHMLPTACCGRQVVTPADFFSIILPIIELSAVQMMGAQNALILRVARARLGLAERGPAELAMLDPLFLEPERAPITDMPLTEKGIQMLESREALSPDRLFSAAELRNNILMAEAAYEEFDLADTEFALVAKLVRRLSIAFIDRDFWIVVSPSDFAALCDELGVPLALRSELMNTAPSYMACLSTYAPFVLVDGVYRSTVTLLSRFVYYWRARSLNRQKRFQIRAGFIFEQTVSAALEQQGFVTQDITRINRHEFDVVTLRSGTIWNVQCKNNFIDLSLVDSDAQRFARYNYMLVKSYERALTKERNREHLLTSALSLNAIQHMVISRFPVVSDNPRIVPFSRIGTFAAKADALVATT